MFNLLQFSKLGKWLWLRGKCQTPDKNEYRVLIRRVCLRSPGSCWASLRHDGPSHDSPGLDRHWTDQRLVPVVGWISLNPLSTKCVPAVSGTYKKSLHCKHSPPRTIMSSQSQALLKPTTSSISATRLLTSFAASVLPISLLLKLRWHSKSDVKVHLPLHT